MLTAKLETGNMTTSRFNVGVASNDRRMFEITIPDVGKIVCEASTKLSGLTAGREVERKDLAKLHAKQLGEALIKAIDGY
jgi:hypothetical protein